VPRPESQTQAIDPHPPLRYPKTMQVSLQYAAEHLADLASAARRGEEVEIAQPDQPTLKLVVSEASIPAKPKTGRRILGAGVGELRVPSEEEWRAMDKELEREMLDAPLITSGEI
jgi:antitoxin (DNA-binding transcriptional repressor) of toxin-antitoxin stability system